MQTESLFLAGAQCHTSVLFGIGAPVTQGGSVRMNANDRLNVGQELKTYGCGGPSVFCGRLVMQADGNLVIYESGGRAIWSTGTNGKPVAFAVMQGDGNFVLYDKNMGHHWDTSTHGNPGAYAVFQNDGNLVVRSAGGKALWDSSTYGWQHHGSGNVITSAVDAVSSAASSVASVASDVVHIVGDAAKAPLDIAQAIASGERLDHVFIDAAKAQLKIIKDAAPYAQAVIAFVPGIGTTAAAAIAGGIALAEGKSIDEAAKSAIRAAIPGGAAALAAYDTATKVLSGQNVTKAMIEAARNAIPEGPARQAYDIGTAVATGEKIQTAIAHGLANMASDQIQKVLAEGAKMVTENPTLKNALAALKASPEVEQGFKIASGLVNQKNMSEKALQAVRNGLTEELRKGFDAAVKTQEPTKPWLANVVGKPSPIKAAPLRVPKPAAPTAASPIKAAPIKAAPPKAAPAASQAVAKTPPGQDRRYGPYPKHAGAVAGVGAGSPAYRWFAVYANGQLTAQQGPRWLSEDAALAERAAYLDSTQGRGYFGAVHQWDWNGRNWLQVA